MSPSVSREIAAPAPVVWDLLTHVAAWPLWGPTVSGAAVPGGVIERDARGTVRPTVGPWLHRVRPTPGGCVVTFSVPWWAPAYLVVCALALRRIERLALEGWAPPAGDTPPADNAVS